MAHHCMDIALPDPQELDFAPGFFESSLPSGGLKLRADLMNRLHVRKDNETMWEVARRLFVRLSEQDTRTVSRQQAFDKWSRYTNGLNRAGTGILSQVCHKSDVGVAEDPESPADRFERVLVYLVRKGLITRLDNERIASTSADLAAALALINLSILTPKQVAFVDQQKAKLGKRTRFTLKI